MALRAEHGNLNADAREIAAEVAAHRRPDRRSQRSRSPTAPAFRLRRTSATSRWIRKPAKTKVLRYTVIQDAGKAIHPDYVEGQFQGAAAQGIGWALNEEYIYGKDGRLQNAGFPRLSDSGLFRPAVHRYADPRDPESGPPVRCPRRRRDVDRAAARGDRATRCRTRSGVRMTHMPMSPPRILQCHEERTRQLQPAWLNVSKSSCRDRCGNTPMERQRYRSKRAPCANCCASSSSATHA